MPYSDFNWPTRIPKFKVGQSVLTNSGQSGIITDSRHTKSRSKYFVVGEGVEKYVQEDDLIVVTESLEKVVICKKKGFVIKSEAVKRRKEIAATSQRSSIPVRVYLCPECKMYHLTSKSRNKE